MLPQKRKLAKERKALKNFLQSPGYDYGVLLPIRTRNQLDVDELDTDVRSDLALPRIISDPILSAAKLGEGLLGRRDMDPKDITQSMLEVVGGSSLLGSVPKGALASGLLKRSNDEMYDFGQSVNYMTDKSLETALPSTKYLVEKLKNEFPGVEFGLNKSYTQMGPSNYLHIKVPNKPTMEIRLSNHSTGTRRIMDYFQHFPDYVPAKGKAPFGRISRESFDRRVNSIIDAFNKI